MKTPYMGTSTSCMDFWRGLAYLREKTSNIIKHLTKTLGDDGKVSNWVLTLEVNSEVHANNHTCLSITMTTS